MNEIVQAFKLFHIRKNKTLGPLFINKRQVIPLGVWLPAESHPTKGFALRPGWHGAPRPHAPHLKVTCGRVWCRVELKRVRPFVRPEIQGGQWYLAEEMKVLEILHEQHVESV